MRSSSFLSSVDNIPLSSNDKASLTEPSDILTINFNASSDILPISCSRDNYVVVGSRSHMSPETETFFEEKKKEHGNVEVMAVGSSLKLCMVAEGKADAYPRYAPTMEWDTGAGHAIAKFAGFSVKQYNSSDDVVYNKENLLNPWFLVS